MHLVQCFKFLFILNYQSLVHAHTFHPRTVLFPKIHRKCPPEVHVKETIHRLLRLQFTSILFTGIQQRRTLCKVYLKEYREIISSPTEHLIINIHPHCEHKRQAAFIDLVQHKSLISLY